MLTERNALFKKLDEKKKGFVKETFRSVYMKTTEPVSLLACNSFSGIALVSVLVRITLPKDVCTSRFLLSAQVLHSSWSECACLYRLPVLSHFSI